MSSSIDERIVEMRFDNQQFESGVQTSLGTIDKLKSALKFNDSATNLQDISKITKNLDFSGISYALSTISDRFSTMGVVGMTVLQDLTQSALNFAKKIIMAVPEKIKSGGWNRAMNLETARFQLEGLGIAWNKILGDINYGVADTAYGLDAAATAAAQLSASGLEFGGIYEEDSKQISMMGKALLGISGVAGQTSRSYEEISNLFISVAGAGRVTGDTLTRMGYKGLNAAADLAKYFNGVNDGAYEASESVMTAVKKITNGTEVSEEKVREDLVGSHCVLFYHSFGIRVKVRGVFPVLHGLGVHLHVHRRAVHSAPCQHRAGGGVRDRHDGALLCKLLVELDRLAAQPKDLERRVRRAAQARLHDVVPVGGVLREGIGAAERLECRRVLIHHPQEPAGKALRLLGEDEELMLHIGVFLFSHGELPHHIAQGDADGAHQGAGSAAPWDGGFGGKLFGKSADAGLKHTHQKTPFPHPCGAGKSILFQNRPEMTPFSSTSIFSAADTLGRPFSFFDDTAILPHPTAPQNT